MKIEEEKLPGFTYFLFATIFLLALSIFAIIGFSIFCYHLADHFINNTSTITFDRGGTFGLGGGIGAVSLAMGGVIVGLLRKKLTEKIQKTLTFGMVIGIVIMLSLPIISSIAVSVYAYNKGYIDCDEAEKKNSWPIYRTNYYTKNETTCIELVEEVKRDRPFL